MYLAVIGIGVGLGIAALLFLKFRKPPQAEEGWFEEDIPVERQPNISSKCGSVIGSPNPNSKGENFTGKVIRRKTYKDNWSVVVYDEVSKRSVELKNLQFGTNILINQNSEAIAGKVNLITNVDANGELCEWDTTGLEMYKKQFDLINKEKGRQEGLQKMKELREERHILRSPYAKPTDDEINEITGEM